MARKPSEPSPKSTGSKTVDDGRATEQRAPATVRASSTGESHADREHAGSTEAAGPVAITRLRKADGRSLILYGAARDRA